jgi:hypothetical protein
MKTNAMTAKSLNYIGFSGFYTSASAFSNNAFTQCGRLQHELVACYKCGTIDALFSKISLGRLGETCVEATCAIPASSQDFQRASTSRE